MTSGDWRLLLKATLMLALVRLGLRLLPFQVVRDLLGRSGADVRPGTGPASAAVAGAARRVLWAVNAATPLTGATCLPRALVTHALLTRQGLASELRIGVARRPGRLLEAHAWVEEGDCILIGDLPNLAHFKPLAKSRAEGQ